MPNRRITLTTAWADQEEDQYMRRIVLTFDIRLASLDSKLVLPLDQVGMAVVELEPTIANRDYDSFALAHCYSSTLEYQTSRGLGIWSLPWTTPSRL
jgi:hypothetical protein